MTLSPVDLQLFIPQHELEPIVLYKSVSSDLIVSIWNREQILTLYFGSVRDEESNRSTQLGIVASI
jgi:hypothetical protein